MSRRILAGFGALALCLPMAAQAQQATADPAEMVEARAIMAISYPEAERDEMFETMIGQVVNQFAGALPAEISDPGLKAILDDYVTAIPQKLMPLVKAHIPKLMEATAEAYSHAYTLEELKQIRAFAETPAGGHYFSTVASLVGDPSVAAANSAYFAQLRELSRTYDAELKEKVMAYLQEHPDVAAAMAKKGSAS